MELDEELKYPIIVATYGGCYIDGYEWTAKYIDLYIVNNEKEAEELVKDAYHTGLERCRDWEGSHGFLSVQEFIEEGYTEEEASQMFEEYIQDEVDYGIVPMTLDIAEGMWEHTVIKYKLFQKIISGDEY